MPPPLLERQISLLEYLTSAGAIFGDDAPPASHLHGLDPALLRLEACFSHEKRMEKIIAAFPHTFEIMRGDEDLADVMRDFVEAYPSVDIRRIENARQFYDFLRARWQRKPPQPPYLRDVATCELAMADVRMKGKAQPSQPVAAGRAIRFRRNRDAVFLPCTYDIRPIFEGGADEAVERRDLMLAILVRAHSEQPTILEVPAPVFALLVELDTWTDRASLGAISELDTLISELAEHGLLEVS
jgi:hypothetical protein